jgi:hypothetical protein
MTMSSIDLIKKATKLVALSALFAATGCVSSPTYGTGKTAGAQLLEDVNNSMSLKPPTQTKIAYQPRPELVKTAAGALPVPQETASKQPGVWPESPELKRARLRQEATDAQGDPLYVPKIKNDLPTGNVTNVDPSSKEAVAEFRKRKAINAAGSPTNRKYLSEPPLEYRDPVSTAAYGDLGEDEIKKERRLRAEARRKKGSAGLKGLIPWL